MNELEAVRERHSVRNYKPERIEEEKVSLIRKKLEELNREGDLHLQFMENAGGTYNKLMSRMMGLASAPSVIACVGKEAEDLDERVGYYGEQLVLYAQTLGLNTCWAGTFNKEQTGAQIGAGERLVISIAIGYGREQGKPHKSKEADKVCEAGADTPEWFKQGVELALLAPTAINQQKFLIRLNEDETVSFIDKGGILSRVDLGIVRYHFELGSGKKQKP